MDVCKIGSRLELLCDRFLVDRTENVDFHLHSPQRQAMATSPLRAGAYATVIKDGDLFRAYYRGDDSSYTGERGYTGHPAEITCYAESRDGHEWTFPELGLIDINGTRNNNVIMAGHPTDYHPPHPFLTPSRIRHADPFRQPFSHNFTPFLDTRPDVDPAERFKALAGHPGHQRDVRTGGLHAFVSPDGLRWKHTGDSEVISFDPTWTHAFDSQNIAFWSEAEEQYVGYIRTWMSARRSAPTPTSSGSHTEAGAEGTLRSISRTTSPDFKQWSKPIPMDPNLPGEHLYTCQTHPYFRAPHIYISLPSRYVAGRVGTEKTHAMLGSTDILFMSTRAGTTSFDRLFTEAMIRPGLDPERWESRANYVALNVVPTGPDEMSIYHSKSGHRYTLRTDGFMSLRAGAQPGEWVSKPLIYEGSALFANYSTSAAGSLRVEMQGADGTPIPECALEKSALTVGDTIEGKLTWEGDPDLGAWAAKPVRLRFVMQECDLYSFQFRSIP